MTRSRILFLAEDRHGATGAGLRNRVLLEALGRRYDLTAISMAEVAGDMAPRPRRGSGRFRFLDPKPVWARRFDAADRRRWRAALERRIDDLAPHLAIVSHATALSWLDAPLSVPTILDAYDLLWVARRRQLETGASGGGGLRSAARRWRVGVEVTLARRYELAAMHRVDRAWVCSDLDRRLLLDRGYRRPVAVVPNTVAAAGDPRRDFGDRGGVVLFVGTLGYHANRDGVSWFLRRVWPGVLRRRPSARFVVVGKRPEWWTPGGEFRQDGVELRGFVDDLEPIWGEADLLVCPLRVGSGTRLKILEAWSRGVPVVSTLVGIEGLGHADGREASVAASSAVLTDRLVEVLGSEEQRERLGRGGHERWRGCYAPQRAETVIQQDCERALGAANERARDPKGRTDDGGTADKVG